LGCLGANPPTNLRRPEVPKFVGWLDPKLVVARAKARNVTTVIIAKAV